MRRRLFLLVLPFFLPVLAWGAPYDYVQIFESGPRGELSVTVGEVQLTVTATHLLAVQASGPQRIDHNLPAGPHHLHLKQRPDGLQVFLDRQLLVELLPLPDQRYTPTVEAAGDFTVSQPLRVQKTGPIVFADDFARIDLQTPLWTSHGGQFEINAAHNPDSAQGAFQLWAHAPTREAWAIATQSYWFWDRYGAGVSARLDQAPGTWGLMVQVQDDHHHFRLECEQQSADSALVRVIERWQGTDRVLAEKQLPLRLGQWQRAEILTSQTTLTAFVNGHQVASIESKHLAGGQVGLYVRRSQQVLFDDLTVRSITGTDELAEPFGPSEQTWADFSKKSFYHDPYMVQWAHPRANWNVAREHEPELQWFRPDLFHDATFHWEHAAGQATSEPVRLLLFADPDHASSGYDVTIHTDRLELIRGGRIVASEARPSDAIKTLAASANEGAVTISINGRQLLHWQDPEPITRGRVAAALGQVRGMHLRAADWRDTAKVTSSHRLDYNFDHAPAAWEVTEGRWQPTHRWACVPKWSFFSGRGVEQDPLGDPTNATLWNRRAFEGDYDLELFLAPLEGTSQRVHFTWPVGMGIAFNAETPDLDSGYFLYYSLYDQASRLFRAGIPVAQNASRVDPLMRGDAMPWYHRITQVWQHIRIRRRDSQVIVDIAAHDDEGNYQGLQRFFEFDDKAPLTGDRVGIFGWGLNGLAIARATISFEDSSGPATPAPPPARPPTPDADGSIHVINQHAGGAFAWPLAESPLTLTPEHGHLTFRFKHGPNQHLSLFAELRGHVAEYGLAGPAVYRPWSVPLGAQSPATGWQSVELDLYAKLREAFPDGPLELDRLYVGSPYETIEERAGLGVNPAGSRYQLADIAWAASSHPPTQRPESPPTPGLLGDFEYDLGSLSNMGGPDGALLYRDSHQPANGTYSLRLLNAHIAGTAGVWLTRDRYDLEHYPGLRFSYRLPPGFELNLVVKANGQWYELRFTGRDASWPLIGTIPNVRQDNTWQQAEIDLLAALRLRLPHGPIAIDSLALTDTARFSSPQGRSYWLDDVRLLPAAEAAPPPAPEQPAPAAPAAPPAPYISYHPSDALTGQTFEWQDAPYDPLKPYGEAQIRRQSWVLRSSDDSATGQGSLLLVNPNRSEFFSTYLHKSGWDPVRWPIIRFDYKFATRGCALNLSMLVDEAMTIVEWTGPNHQNYFTSAVIGATEPAIQDGSWHHVEIDLLQMIRSRRYPNADSARPIEVTELATWATSHHRGGYQNKLGAEVKIDNLSIASNRGHSPAFSWKVHDYPHRVGGYAVVFDQLSDTVPAPTVTTQDTTATFSAEPGAWYLHVRAVDSAGNWGPAAHYRVEIAP